MDREYRKITLICFLNKKNLTEGVLEYQYCKKKTTIGVFDRAPISFVYTIIDAREETLV